MTGRRLVALLAALGLAGLGMFTATLALLAPAPRASDAATPFEEEHAQAPELSLMVLGTSLTARYDWATRLQEEVSACLKRPVRLTTIARSGETSSWGHAAFLERKEDGPEPDIVLIEFIANDADLRRQISPAASRGYHAAMISDIHSHAPEARILLVNMNPVFGLRRLARPRLAQYVDGYEELAAGDPQVGFADLIGAWTAHLTTEKRGVAIPDGLHPSQDAARAVIPDALLAPLLALFERTTCEA